MSESTLRRFIVKDKTGVIADGVQLDRHRRTSGSAVLLVWRARVRCATVCAGVSLVTLANLRNDLLPLWEAELRWVDYDPEAIKAPDTEKWDKVGQRVDLRLTVVDHEGPWWLTMGGSEEVSENERT